MRTAGDRRDGGLIDGCGVLFVRRCDVVGVTRLRGNYDASARTSDVHETDVAHRTIAAGLGRDDHY